MKHLGEKYVDTYRMRTALCKTCHGKEGYSVRPLTPNLAGQNPVYIVDQFSAFADGRRKNYMMSNLAANFTQEDMIKIAIYYSHEPAFSDGKADPLLVEEGRKLYSNYCTECHGKNANGPKGYARLAGQRADYIVKALKDFKQPGGDRSSSIMYGRAQLLRTEEHMQAVAAYLSQL
ncbi:MAG: c-type cytochrome [gamma proteobacterium symbiont of Bathyaustriella thionipta]|nr:c-type cytochrome [gamma proteobacterium symbiont of Bathyaustriella thionipta]